VCLYIPRPAGWAKILPPAQAKEIIVAWVNSVSAKTYVSTVREDSCRVSCYFCIFRTFDIFTQFGEHGRTCSMSKSKLALRTTKTIHAVWLEIHAVWLGIYTVQCVTFLVEVFKLHAWIICSSMWRNSLPLLWNWENPIPLKTSLLTFIGFIGRHNLLEPFKIQKLPSHLKSSVWGLGPPKVNFSTFFHQTWLLLPRLF